MSVSRATNAMLAALRRELPPLIQPERIELCSPSDKGETLLGLYLTDISADKRFRLSGRMTLDERTLGPPPLCVELTYMLTSYVGLPDDHKLLERVLQIWYDSPKLGQLSHLQPDSVPDTEVTLMDTDPDTRSKLWQFPGEPYRVSLFYRVAPVVIESTKTIPVARVKTIDFETRNRQ